MLIKSLNNFLFNQIFAELVIKNCTKKYTVIITKTLYNENEGKKDRRNQVLKILERL